MSIVGRKGKLSVKATDGNIEDVAWERYEDVLTADVFGAYRYLPPTIGIIPFLAHARDEFGQTLAEFLRRFGVDLTELDVARTRLWPAFADGSEPDVIVMLEGSGSGQVVPLLVEAKLHAKQHVIETDHGSRSQIGHYLDQHLSGAYAADRLPWELPVGPRPLVFITMHGEIPVAELSVARQEVREAHPELPDNEIGLFWINWGYAGVEADSLWRLHRGSVETRPWLRLLLDLREEIASRDLMPRPPFRGIRHMTRKPSPWMYRRVFADGCYGGCDLTVYRQRRFAASGGIGLDLLHVSSYRSRFFGLHPPGWCQLPAINMNYGGNDG